MLRTDVWGAVPGLTTATETYEAAFRWGQYGVGIITGGLIDANTIDSGNSPTFELRPGLLLGQKIATGTWINYAPTNTDGSEVAAAVLLTSVRIQDLQGVNQQRFYGILVGGPVQASKIIGLDGMARQQMEHFQFDDLFGIGGFGWFPWKRFQAKTANYVIVSTDNFSQFDNTGAVGAVTFTLPAILNGYAFGFRVIADQSVTVSSAEGSNMVGFNLVTASNIAFTTGGAKIGGGLTIFSNPGATKWIVVNTSAGANTITTT